MARPTVKEVKRLLRLAIQRQNGYVEAFTGSDNPQTVEMRKHAQAQVEAYESVLLALEGDAVLLRIAAEFSCEPWTPRAK